MVAMYEYFQNIDTSAQFVEWLKTQGCNGAKVRAEGLVIFGTRRYIVDCKIDRKPCAAASCGGTCPIGLDAISLRKEYRERQIQEDR